MWRPTPAGPQQWHGVHGAVVVCETDEQQFQSRIVKLSKLQGGRALAAAPAAGDGRGGGGGRLVHEVSPRPRPPATPYHLPGIPSTFRVHCLKYDDGRVGTSTPDIGDLSDDELLTSRPQPNSFRAVIAHLLVTGHLIGILPVSSAVDVVPVFHWTSPRVLFSLFVVSTIVLRICVYSSGIFTGYMSAFDTFVSTRIGFHMMSATQLLLYVRLARRWRPFVLIFLRLERRQGDDTLRPRLRLQAKIVTGILLTFALGDYVLQVTTHSFPRKFSEYQSVSEVIQAHYEFLYDNMARVFPYSAPSWALAEITTAVTNLTLNYNDVFIIIVSRLIVRRFKMMRGQLVRATLQKDNASYWKEARESFNDLSELTHEVDSYLSALVLLSCLQNFFTICIQLQHTVRLASANLGIARKLYFLFSFMFVLLRSATVVLSASGIPEESKAVKRVLYALPPKQYSEEVRRFLAQVTGDEIALTGLGLFSITRSFLLKMLGTIATYEILLVQMYRTSYSNI